MPIALFPAKEAKSPTDLALPPTIPSSKAEIVGGIQSRKSYGNKPTLEMWAIVLRTAKLNVLIKYELSTPSPPSWRSSSAHHDPEYNKLQIVWFVDVIFASWSYDLNVIHFIQEGWNSSIEV